MRRRPRAKHLKQNMSSTNVFIKGTLEEQKKAVRTDLGPVPEVTVDFMLRHIIPNSQINVTATMESLKEQMLWSESEGWSEFRGKSPLELSKVKSGVKGSASNNKETEIFRKLRAVYGKIVSSAKFHNSSAPRPTLSFEQFPNIAPTSDTDVRSRPDGCALLTSEQAIHTTKERPLPPKEAGRPNWFDVAYVEEYKLSDKIKHMNDNIWKIIWSLHHAMHVDHRRRFVFGLTIENRKSRIWFACRQIVLVSQPFDFSQDALKLVHLIASLAYASPTQLGYDPTMFLRWRKGGWYYDIKMTTQLADGTEHTQIYNIYRVICNSANSIRGRATRVYEAYIYAPPTNQYKISRRVVIKDSWIDIGRMREGDTLAQLLEGATPDEKRLFLTVVQHGIVQIDGRDDCTQDLILNGHTFFGFSDLDDELVEPDDEVFLAGVTEGLKVIEDSEGSEPDTSKYNTPLFPLYHPEPGKDKTPSIKTSSTRDNQSSAISQTVAADALAHHTHHVVTKPIIYSPKYHYRIVFEEVGISLMSLAGSGKLRASVVHQALVDGTLALRYMAKRGYVHRDVSAGNILMVDGRAKLADLEFTKLYGSGQTSYVRTGTYSFMSGEVARGRYTDRPEHKNFLHNPIHDLESLWWVGVWCLMWHYPVSEYQHVSPSEKEHIDKMKEHGMKLFPSYHQPLSDRRITEIHSQVKYRRRDVRSYPLSIKVMIARMNDVRQCISWAHQRIQRALPRDDASYFSDVLCVADPSTTVSDMDTENHPRLPIFEMVISKLERVISGIGVPNDLLWPLESIDDHKEWLKSRTRLKLREEDNGTGVINFKLDGDGYFDT